MGKASADDLFFRFLQSYPLVLLFVGLQLVAAVVHWYFHDQDRVASIEHERSAKKAVIEYFSCSFLETIRVLRMVQSDCQGLGETRIKKVGRGVV